MTAARSAKDIEIKEDRRFEDHDLKNLTTMRLQNLSKEKDAELVKILAKSLSAREALKKKHAKELAELRSRQENEVKAPSLKDSGKRLSVIFGFAKSSKALSSRFDLEMAERGKIRTRKDEELNRKRDDEDD